MRHTARPPPPWPGEERGRECRRGRPAPRSPPAPRPRSAPHRQQLQDLEDAVGVAAVAQHGLQAGGERGPRHAVLGELRPERGRNSAAAGRRNEEHRTRAGYKMYTLLQLRVGYSAIPHSAAGARTGVQRPGDARQRSEQRRNLQHGAALQQRTALSIGQRCPGRLLCRAHSGTAPP